jgi:hypothetical protein
VEADMAESGSSSIEFSIKHEPQLRKLAEGDSNIRILLEEIDRLRESLSIHRKWLDRARKQAASLDGKR